MLNPAVKQLPGETQAVYLQAIFKVYASAVLAYSQGIRPTGAVGALPAEVEPLAELARASGARKRRRRKRARARKTRPRVGRSRQSS